MLDHDHCADDARRLLSQPARDSLGGPGGWTRRGFLQAIGAGVIGGAVLGTLGEGLFDGELLGGQARAAFAATPVGAGDGILITIMLYGGNDGLNTVVPYGDGNYYSQRGGVSIPAGQVLAINNQVGLHPNLGYVKSLYDAGDVAIVQGVGYAGPDLSHFASMGVWMNSSFGGGIASTGWIGRWLDGQTAAVADLAAATIDTSVALHLVGAQRRGFAVSPSGEMFGQLREPTDLRMYDGFRTMAASPSGRGALHDMFASTIRQQVDVAAQMSPIFAAGLPDNEFARKMVMAARMVNADLGMRVIDIPFDGFDNHGDELWSHGRQLADLDAGIKAFIETLLPRYRDQVTIMTMSEFGRTSYSNGSGGTDHGTASNMFVIGNKVKGGLYGAAPTLAGLRRWDRMAHTVDFRSVIGTVVDGWLGGGGSSILKGNFENLGLFTGGPSGIAPVPVVVLPPATPSGFESITPMRVIDTRDGTGGRSSPLGNQESWKVVLAGRNGIPADAVAVAMNLVAVDATAPTFVTVYPFGEARPWAANLNPTPGAITPNLVVARVGLDGAVNIFNNTGSVHLIADVVGYFVMSSDVGLNPLDPARLLDTRDGTGVDSGEVAAVGAGEWIDLQVTGRCGVPDDTVAVALNIAATDSTVGSFLTVWPTGVERPVASSLNMTAGKTVSNMVLARVGDDGRVSIFNASGSTNVIVDVLGAFRPGARSRYVPLSPARALDTRDGTGVPRARVQRNAVGLPLSGRAGIPAGAASAVLMNVTAVTPSAGTYVTVFPSGRERPLASNINADAGAVVPNMVLARLGEDGGASVYNNTGEVDLVADVMGYFTI